MVPKNSPSFFKDLVVLVAFIYSMTDKKVGQQGRHAAGGCRAGVDPATAAGGLWSPYLDHLPKPLSPAAQTLSI